MELNYLKEFIVLAQTGNFLEAADQLFISQSTLSKHIKAVEAELGVPLFDRTTRRVALNRYGQMMLRYARRIIQLQGAYTEKLSAARHSAQGCLELGSIPALAPYQLTDVMARFRQDHGVALHITQGGTAELKEMLARGRCELAFLREVDIPQGDGLVRLPYATDTLVAVLPLSHCRAGQKQVALADLRDEEFLMIQKPSMLYDLSLSACLRSGFAPRVAFSDHKPDHLVDFVQKGMGVALLMKHLVSYLQNPNVSIVEVTPGVSTQISLCHRKNARLSEAAAQFWAYTKGYLAENR